MELDSKVHCWNSALDVSPIFIAPDSNDVRPNIQFDVGAGRIFKNIQIDPYRVADRMRQEGVSDEDIQDKTVLITTQTLNAEAGMDNKLLVHAFYNTASGLISLTTATHAEDARQLQMNSDKDASEKLSRSLFHEIRHLGQDHKFGVDVATEHYARHVLLKMAACLMEYGEDSSKARTQRLLWWSKYGNLKGSEIYFNNPTEIDAREAERDVCPDSEGNLPIEVELRY